MASERSFQIPAIWAASATTVIPPTPTPGVSYRDESVLASVIETGWSFRTVLESSAANQALHQAFSVINEVDKRGIPGWSDQIDYTTVPALVRGSDGNYYKSLQASGPSTAVQDPISSPTFWELFDGTVYTAGTNVQISPTGVISATDTNTDTTYTAGTALDLNGTEFNLDLSELTISSSDGDTDTIVTVDEAGNQQRVNKGNINLSGFNNDAGFTTSAGTITEIIAGTNLSGGGISGSVTVNFDGTVDNLDFSNNTISSTDTNGDINLEPNGNGDLRLGNSTGANITIDNDGEVTINRSGGLRCFFTFAEGQSIQSSTTNNPLLQFFQDDGTTRNGFIHFRGDTGLQIFQQVPGLSILFQSVDVGGVARSGFVMNPDAETTLRGDTNLNLQVAAGENAIVCNANGSVDVYNNNVLVGSFLPAASGGLEVENTLTGTGRERVLTTSDLPSGSDILARVSSNITVPGTSPITALTVAVESNSFYTIDAFILVGFDSFDDVSLDFTIPTGTTGQVAATLHGTGVSESVLLSDSITVISSTLSFSTNGFASQPDFIRITGTIQTSSTAGNISLRAAKLANTSSDDGVIIANSWIKLTELP